MNANSPRWTTVSDSPHDHEREALAFLRRRLLDREPYRVWSNFEFTTANGKLYEVDALAITDNGVHLIEIKSHPGQMGGDGSTWQWTTPEGARRSLDNPRLLASRKAKALKELLERSKAFAKHRSDVPYVTEVVFLSDPDLTVTLSPPGRHQVFGRDAMDNEALPPQRKAIGGIVEALTSLAPSASGRPQRRIDRPTGARIAEAIEQSGIRERSSRRRFGDYRIVELLADVDADRDTGVSYQDFLVEHASLAGMRRRLRLYPLEQNATTEQREAASRAARREFLHLHPLDHPGILAPVEFFEHERGPCLLFEHDPEARALDRWLLDPPAEVGPLDRLNVVRQVAEALSHAHGNGVFHRALCPSADLVAGRKDLRVQVANWHAGARVTTGEATAALVGLLNSAVACFWMKQVFQKKTRTGGGGGASDAPFTHQHEFDGTKLKQFPIPPGSALGWARRLDDSARELSDNLPAAVAGRAVPTCDALDAARGRVDALRTDMVAIQEELDWRCLHLYGVTPDDLSLPPGEAPPIDRGQRAFEIVLARQMAAGELRTTWFERHGSTPITELPDSWPEDYKRLVERRIELIESDRFVGLVERPECKRRWNWAAWEDLEQEALRTWLLDRLEEPRYWPDTVPRSAAQLADAAGRDADFVQVAELYAGTVDVDLTTLVSALVRDEAVPYLAAWRYTESGLRTRAAWERTWDLQRREDAGEDVGTIPVPPKYGQGDFADKASWKLRGKLDLPKERFVAYPGLGRETDPTPLVGWAGWDHLQCAQALATTYEQRRSVDGWSPERLMPILAGLAELVPWLRQWQNNVDPATGLRLGDFFAEFVATESAANGFGADDLAAWKRPARTAGRRRANRST